MLTKVSLLRRWKRKKKGGKSEATGNRISLFSQEDDDARAEFPGKKEEVKPRLKRERGCQRRRRPVSRQKREEERARVVTQPHMAAEDDDGRLLLRQSVNKRTKEEYRRRPNLFKAKAKIVKFVISLGDDDVTPTAGIVAMDCGIPRVENHGNRFHSEVKKLKIDSSSVPNHEIPFPILVSAAMVSRH